MLVARWQISARENIPASVYIAFRSIARTPRSANKSAAIAIRNKASERGSIANNFGTVPFQNPPGLDGPSRSAAFRGGTVWERDFFWVPRGYFFTNGTDDSRASAESQAP